MVLNYYKTVTKKNFNVNTSEKNNFRMCVLLFYLNVWHNDKL